MAWSPDHAIAQIKHHGYGMVSRPRHCTNQAPNNVMASSPDHATGKTTTKLKNADHRPCDTENEAAG
jgi:hypothetical protein